MLINCPKCGFSQPQDKYCAQCGVDMESYRPAEVPFFKRFITHPGTQFFILLVFLAGALQFFYFRDRNEMSERIAFLQGNVQISSAEQSSLSIERTLDEAEASNPEPSAALPTVSTVAAVASTDTTTSLTEQKSSAEKTPSIQMTFYEVPKAGLQKLFEDSQNEGHFGDFKDYTTGMIDNFDQKKESFQMRELSQQKVLLNQNTGSVTLGLKDSSATNVLVGFQTYFYYQQMNPTLGRLNVELIRGWRESTEPSGIQSREFPVQVELSSKTALFISGIMPRQTNLTEQDEDALINTPGFKILSSPDFLGNLSEFVVVIEVVDQ